MLYFCCGRNDIEVSHKAGYVAKKLLLTKVPNGFLIAFKSFVLTYSLSEPFSKSHITHKSCSMEVSCVFLSIVVEGNNED